MEIKGMNPMSRKPSGDELQKLGLTPAQLSLRSDRDRAKLQIATRLRAETTITDVRGAE